MKRNYELEPNVSFTPDVKWLVFRANMFGPTASTLSLQYLGERHMLLGVSLESMNTGDFE